LITVGRRVIFGAAINSKHFYGSDGPRREGIGRAPPHFFVTGNAADGRSGVAILSTPGSFHEVAGETSSRPRNRSKLLL
jgi:hypothetical protein